MAGRFGWNPLLLPFTFAPLLLITPVLFFTESEVQTESETESETGHLGVALVWPRLFLGMALVGAGSVLALSRTCGFWCSVNFGIHKYRSLLTS